MSDNFERIIHTCDIPATKLKMIFSRNTKYPNICSIKIYDSENRYLYIESSSYSYDYLKNNHLVISYKYPYIKLFVGGNFESITLGKYDDDLDNNNFDNALNIDDVDDIEDLKILIDKKAELETIINKIDKRILQIKDNFIF
jgi:hypothetical protein